MPRVCEAPQGGPFLGDCGPGSPSMLRKRHRNAHFIAGSEGKTRRSSLKKGLEERAAPEASVGVRSEIQKQLRRR